MKIKTSELTGAALDWAVAIAAKMTAEIQPAGKCGRPLYVLAAEQGYTPWIWNPSESWHQGGPIIERERISIRQWTNVPVVHSYMPQDDAPWSEDGTSPLIAAMRCYVVSKLGDEVDVPEELICSPASKNV